MKRIAIISAVTAVVAIFSGSRYADVAETWKVKEIAFQSEADYDKQGGDLVVMDVIFTNLRTGKVLSRPGFWDGGNSFLVRFAPPSAGRWQWKSVCLADKSLDGRSGSFRCVRYRGRQDIYRHGFVQCREGLKYMIYADGTPFFYLGDTHWGMYTEEIDAPGPHAGKTGADSHFKYIVDKRVEQGFTVYQSEPIGAGFSLTDGRIDSSDIDGFKAADKYYQYIADAGLVHANAEFFFASYMNGLIAFNDSVLERLSRYWVARFGAYPVIWTLAQECDNDFYFERGDQKLYDSSRNPWVRIAEFIHRYDCYSHPLSAHQESTHFTTVTGRGTGAANASNGGRSAFCEAEVADRTGHNWWAAQWSPSLVSSPGPDCPRDYWASERPAVNYEGRYCGLWTMDFGARAQGWISFLSGFCGYGYGAVDMWLYQSTYDIGKPSFDGIDSISVADKMMPWCESLEYPSALQMSILRSFMESFDWWNLTPLFTDDPAFAASEGAAFAHAKTPEMHVFYFYGQNKGTGTISGLTPGRSVIWQWYNPRTGKKGPEGTLRTDPSGSLVLPAKADDQDWVLTLR